MDDRSPGGEPRRDSWLYSTISRVLLAGMVVSVCLMLAGMALDFAQGHPLATDVMPAHEAIASALHGGADGLVSLGILVLLATPITYVVLGLADFLWERDWRLVATTLVVLGVLCAGAFLGLSNL